MAKTLQLKWLKITFRTCDDGAIRQKKFKNRKCSYAENRYIFAACPFVTTEERWIFCGEIKLPNPPNLIPSLHF